MTTTVALFDIAGTIVSINPWVFILVQPEVNQSKVRWEKIRFIPTYYGNKLGLVGDVTFRHHWIIGMARLFKGWKRQSVHKVFDRVVNQELEDAYYPKVLDRIAYHKQQGHLVILVSGMFDMLVQAFAERVGADIGLGTGLAFDGDVCAGKITGASLMGARKVDAVKQALASRQIQADFTQSYAYADSVSDIPLLASVGHPVATYPEPKLQTHAENQGWDILNGDMS